MKPARCARCGTEFVRARLYPVQRYCSQRCQRSELKRRSRLRRREASPATCDNIACRKDFQRSNPRQRFCSNACRYVAFRGANPPAPRKSLRCKWCRGKHLSSACPNPSGVLVKQYGSLGPNREYVPPPGVSVRHIQIPTTIHGDRLSQILKELDP